MALLEIRNFSFTYAGEKEEALKNISLMVNEGEIIALCGPTGCGKTTLLKQMKQEIRPIGTAYGHVFYNQTEIDEVPKRIAAKEIGMVFQDPENQIVTSTVWHELAFSLENFGYSTNEMRKRIAEMATFFGLESLLKLSIHELSGGQKQLVNLASVLLLQPRLLLLDEPTAQLDPIAAREFLEMIQRINKEFSTTVIMIEHRLEDVFPIVDRVIFLKEGRKEIDDTPRSFIQQIDQADPYFHYLPEITKLFLLKQNEPYTKTVPITVREGTEWVNSLSNLFPVQARLKEKKEIIGENILECRDVFFQYNRKEKLILEGVNFSMKKGMFAGIIGGNGAGKTTLLKILAGLDTPQRGRVLLNGKHLKKIKLEERYKRIGYLSQNPLAFFTQEKVMDELNLVAEKLGAGSEKAVKKNIEFFELGKLLHKHPYDLSGGERQKLALSCILLENPQVLLMDEPTKGLDPKFKQDVGRLIKELQKNKDLSILMVTHDIEFAAKYTDYCSLLFSGSIVAEGIPPQMFSENYFYTTAINRIVRSRIPEALTYEDVLAIWNEANFC